MWDKELYEKSIKEQEAINRNTPDYLRGLSDGYKEGYNTAMEQIAALEKLRFLLQKQLGVIPITGEGKKREVNPEFLNKYRKAVWEE